MNQLAYIGHDGALYTTGFEGGVRQRAAGGDMVCSWPSWSPDGRRVAFSGFRSGFNGHGVLGMYVKDLGEDAPRLVYVNEPGTDAIARRTPHYALWSPDSSRLAFIAQTLTGGLSLFVHDTARPGQPVRLLDGGPLYFSWSPDSRYILAHSHVSHYLLDVIDGGEPRQMPGSATLYMAPSWSPTRSRMAFFRDLSDERQRLIMGDLEGVSVHALIEVEGKAAFAWSPGGDSIALVQDLEETSGYYSSLWLLSADDGHRSLIVEDLVLAFFWSPDGSRIAYVTSSEDARGSIRWAVLNVESGETAHLADFRPTQEQIITFMFFDQYGQSHSPWSPDGRYLIFSGVLGYHKERGPLPEGSENSVFVTDAEGVNPPVKIAQGVFGSWSRA